MELIGDGRARGNLQVLHFLKRIAAAREPCTVLKVVQDYLLAWPKERVGDLQELDGGWAPFDREQNPLSIDTLGHLALYQEAVHRQCLALIITANLQLTPEIMELDEVLTIANRFAKGIRKTEIKELPVRIS